jgi:N-acetylneuraminate synthase
MGSYRISATESNEQKREFRRSIVITRDMNKGDIIKAKDIDYKRPGGNLDPSMTDFIIGRTANKNLENDHILTLKDIV